MSTVYHASLWACPENLKEPKFYRFKMIQQYADLTLYFGRCNADGRGEGRFDANAKDDWSRRRYMHAMENVQRYLSPGWGYGLTVVGGYLVSSEQEALTLIQHAETNIPNSHALVELVDSMHGDIRFFRKIRFNGAVESQRDELIRQMKKTGYVPKDPERERLAHALGGIYSGEKLEAVLNGKGIGPEKMWNKALEFNPI